MAASDKLLLLQSQAVAKEEEAKMKTELLTRFLKEKLAREEQTSTLNLQKIHTQWQALLRKAKAKELRQDIAVLSQAFARMMDRKDSIIELLVTDLDQVEEQHARPLRSHLDNIDRLLQLQRCRLAFLEEVYGAQWQVLETEFEAERRSILEQREQESRYLQAMVLATEQNYTKNDHEAMLNFQSMRDDTKNKTLLEKYYCRMELSGKAEALWEQFQHAMQSYMEATEHQRIAFEELKQKDKKRSKEIEMQTKKLQKLQDLVAATKDQMLAHLHESEEQNQRMRKEKKKVLRQLQELKGEMKEARASAHNSLAVLTVQSNTALKVLAWVVKKAERILQLAEMCRRLETEEEKVLPFYPSSLAEDEQRDARWVLVESPTEPLARALRDYVGLERFWQRFNKVKLEEQALERERVALSQRNRWLRELLRRYLAGFSITREVLSEPNLLLAVEHKSCIPRDSSRTWGTMHEVGKVWHAPTPSWTPSSAPLAPNPPAKCSAQPAARGHRRNRDCPEVP
ncbi:dynein regulatory complex subunit 2 isoform X2 [Cuculus canorus]|uniref:dynein regulatory complex subunit 2 isoform X2 n=1 Tax=Cuculus canorus TaxID=55661 RepID=UPI0023AAC5EC|nr:dynein regulatory complex subunit 2 isoform X2 [Cuculus canorus]